MPEYRKIIIDGQEVKHINGRTPRNVTIDGVLYTPKASEPERDSYTHLVQFPSWFNFDSAYSFWQSDELPANGDYYFKQLDYPIENGIKGYYGAEYPRTSDASDLVKAIIPTTAIKSPVVQLLGGTEATNIRRASEDSTDVKLTYKSSYGYTTSDTLSYVRTRNWLISDIRKEAIGENNRVHIITFNNAAGGENVDRYVFVLTLATTKDTAAITTQAQLYDTLANPATKVARTLDQAQKYSAGYFYYYKRLANHGINLTDPGPFVYVTQEGDTITVHGYGFNGAEIGACSFTRDTAVSDLRLTDNTIDGESATAKQYLHTISMYYDYEYNTYGGISGAYQDRRVMSVKLEITNTRETQYTRNEFNTEFDGINMSTLDYVKSSGTYELYHDTYYGANSHSGWQRTGGGSMHHFTAPYSFYSSSTNSWPMAAGSFTDTVTEAQ